MATGLFTTTQFAADHAKKSFAGMITRLMPSGSAPLFGLTSMLKTEVALSVQHGFFTKTLLFPEMTLSAAVADGAATTFTVNATGNIMPGMLFRVDSTGENVIVNSVVSGTSITVSRGVGTVAAAAIANGVKLYQVGNAYEEASNRPNPQQVQPIQITNLTQIFRNSWALSGTVRATQMIVGDGNVAESRADCAGFHATAIETGLFFGQKSTGTRNGQPFRTMDGLISLIGNLSYYPPSYSSANVTALGATTNYTQLEAALDVMFNQTTDPKAANERVLFCGGTAKKVLNNIGRLNGQYQLVDGQTTWGLQFSSFKLSRGQFRVIEHPLFNTNATWSKMAVGLDLSAFNIAYLGDRKTQNDEYGNDGKPADNGQDAIGGTLTTELTCVLKNPPACAVLTNFTAAAQG